MRATGQPHRRVHDAGGLNRPVRIPGDAEARSELARDLSNGDPARADCMLHLPLMEVALEGIDGIATALRLARIRAAGERRAA